MIIGHPQDRTKDRKINVKASCPNYCYNTMEYLLHDTELERLRGYEQMWFARFGRPASQDIDAIVHLGDNPLHRCIWSANGAFPSFRTNMMILWHCHSSTIVLGKEKLAIQGWPVYGELSEAAGIQSGFHFPNYRYANRFAGNAFNVAAFGFFWISCLASVELT